MGLVPLLILLSSIDVVTMNITRGCFTPANKSCNDTTLSCGDNQIIDIQNIQRIGMCKEKDGCVKWWRNFRRSYHVRYKDGIWLYKQCSSQQSCVIVSPHGQNGNYDYMKYTYDCLKVTTTSTTDSSTMVTTVNSIFNYTLSLTSVNTTNTHIHDNNTNTDAMKETKDCNNSSSGALKETDDDNSKTDTMNETGCSSVITTVVVTVTVVIVVEVVVVLIVIFIYRKRRVKHALNNDRVMKTDKTTDAYDEITNFNGYETAGDPGLRTTMSPDQPSTETGRGYNTLVSTQAVTTDLTETIGKTCKPETLVYHILQPDEKPAKDRESDLKPSDTYDHIGENNPMQKDKKHFNTPVQHPSVPLTTLINYENIELGDDCNIKDEGTYNHLYSVNNKTKPDAGVTRHIDGASVTTNLNDDDIYNHLHDTPADEKSDVSLDTMDDNSYTRPDVMNDNSEDNDTYNHLHEG